MASIAQIFPELARLAGRAKRLGPGEALFRQGDPAIGLYEIASGQVRLERHDLTGRKLILHNARDGESLAEASLFSDRYHCDAVAVTETQAVFFAKAELLREMRRNPEAAEAFMAALARQVQGLRARLELRNIRSAEARLLAYCALQADRAGRVALAGNLKDLAAEIGLTHEALYRALAALERKERIVREDGAIILRSPV